MENSGSAGQAQLLRTRNGEVPQILLAEDSLAARILTAALLRRMGCAVDEAEHGEEALAAITARDYHTVILDIEMPVMDGITAARAIRALPDAKARTPLVALSAFLADSGDSRHWLTLFDLTHAKPASREGLRRVVSAMLARGAKPEAVAVTETCNATAESLIDEAAIRMMRQQFPAEDWAHLMHKAVAEMRENLAQIQRAFEAADRPAIRRLSHRVKGLARTFAAPRLAGRAERLENGADESPACALAPEIAKLQGCLDETVSELLLMRAA